MEAVDLELDRLISRRASQDRRPDRDENEELWKASCRAHAASRHEEMRAAWEAFHEGQAERLRRTLEPLIAFHEARAEECRNQAERSGMSTKKRDGKVTSENVPSGRKFPRKSGLADETKNKGAGSRKLKPKRTIVNHAGRR